MRRTAGTSKYSQPIAHCKKILLLIFPDHLRAAMARGALVRSVARLDVFRHAEVVEPALRHRELGVDAHGADHALDGLAALGTLLELGLGQLLHGLEAFPAFPAAAGDGGV